MGVVNIEKNIYDRVITQLEGIDGSSNYNFNISSGQVEQRFKFPEECNVSHSRPVICIGEQRTGPAERKRRGEFEIPYSLEVWGYTKDSSDPLGECNKLLSDVRVALAGAEFLNDLVRHFSFETSMGADGDLGIINLKITATAFYDTDE